MGVEKFVSGRDTFSMKSHGTGTYAEKYRKRASRRQRRTLYEYENVTWPKVGKRSQRGTKDESSTQPGVETHPCNICRLAVGEVLREGSVWSSNSRSDCRSIVSCTTGTLAFPSAWLISSGCTTLLSFSVTLWLWRVNVCESDTQRYKVFMSCQVVILQSQTYRHGVPLQCV